MNCDGGTSSGFCGGVSVSFERLKQTDGEGKEEEEGGEGEGDWMDVDGEGTTPNKKVKSNSGGAIMAKRAR